MPRRIALAALLALAGGTLPGVAAMGAAGAAQRVTVVLTEYRFAPDRLVFRRGQAYRLLLENRGRELHEFTAPEFFKAIALETPDVLARGNAGDVVLAPGERKELAFVTSTAGRFRLICADHDWAGMTGEIVIE